MSDESELDDQAKELLERWAKEKVMSKITMVRQFTVDRTTWSVETMRNANGLMCCLGHHARACGATDDLIDYMGMPEYVVINAQNNCCS